jgi:serine-type D-Ala-D-Ala carboxypeptidase
VAASSVTGGRAAPVRAWAGAASSPGDAVPSIVKTQFSCSGRRALALLLEELEAAGIAPGFALGFVEGSSGDQEIITVGGLGYQPDAPRVTARTLYDLASVTKLMATTAVAMSLAAEGRLDLTTPVCEVLPGHRGGGKELVTIGGLLSHTAGYAAWAPFHLGCRGEAAVRAAVRLRPLAAPPSTRTLYSDLGMIVLGEVVEKLGGHALDELVRDRVLDPLGLTDTGFRPSLSERSRVAPTERDPWRGGIVHGEVHDENAYAMGGVAPHAGLFSSVGDVLRFGRSLLPRTLAEHRLVPREVVERFAQVPSVPDARWTYGFRRLGRDPLFGTRLSADAVGLTGFTGTLLVFDFERDLAMALLSNRIHPTRANQGIVAARGLVLDTVLADLDLHR